MRTAKQPVGPSSGTRSLPVAPSAPLGPSQNLGSSTLSRQLSTPTTSNITPKRTLPVPPPEKTIPPPENAAHKLIELLKHPDDLVNKLPNFKAKISSKKASLEAQLKTSVQGELNDSQEGIFLLHRGDKLLSIVRERLGKVERECEGARNVIGNYPRIKKVAATHKNFIATRDMVTQFQNLTARIEKLRLLLANDLDDLKGPATNLLLIHSQLFELEAFKEETLYQAKKSPQQVQLTLTQYFKRLDSLSEQFKNYLWTLSRNVLEILKENQGSVIVRLGRILEYEEEADEKVLIALEAQEKHAQLIAKEQASGSKTVSFTGVLLATPTRSVRNYRATFIEILHKNIGDIFTAKFSPIIPPSSPVKPGKDPDSNLPPIDVALFFTTADFIFEDLTLVQWELTPRLPPHYNIFNNFVVEYHKQIFDYLQKVLKRNLQAKDILTLTKWCSVYYTRLERQLQVPPELLEPPLMDTQATGKVHEAYMRSLRQKLNDWMSNIINSEIKDFKERSKEPESDVNGLYVTSTDVIMFQMVTQQLDVVSHHSHLMPLIATECIKVLLRFVDELDNALSNELALFFSPPKNLIVPDGIDVWIMAMSNNSVRCGDFVQTLSERLEKEVESVTFRSLKPQIEQLNERFMGLSRKGTSCLVDIVVRDIKPVFSQLFIPSWYDLLPSEDPLKLVYATLDDYFGDIQSHLMDYLFNKMVIDTAERVCLIYCESLRAKNVKLRSNAPDKMTVQINEMLQFFNGYKKSKKVERTLDILHKLVEVISGSKSFLFLGIWNMWKAYPDTPTAFIEDVLYKRDDLDKASIKEVMEQWKRKIKESGDKEIEGERASTFLTRL